jgi:quaternary ammonium compound-resistance protein SugE
MSVDVWNGQRTLKRYKPVLLAGPATTFPPLRVSGLGRPGGREEAVMAWVALLFAGIFEIVWASAMKQSDGFTRVVPTIVMAVAMSLSFMLLAWSMKVLPLGTAYTIWTGIGALGAFVIGVAYFGEALSTTRVVAVVLLVSGLILMKLSTPA